MHYDENLIVGKVPKKIRERTKENMEKYNMALTDSFEEAVRKFAKKGTELLQRIINNCYIKPMPLPLH